MTAIANRYDFVLLFDVTRGNPNGDPDAGNMPRMDPETNFGLVSDVSLKRKIRNYVEFAHRGEEGKHIYVQEGAILNEQHRQAYHAMHPNDPKIGTASKLNPASDVHARKLTDWMCTNFFDVRTFGAVMSTGVNCGQVRGPVQIAFAQSIEPILPQEITITRMAATNEAEKKQKTEDDGSLDRTDNRTMGRKHIVPYALYRVHGFISAKLAERTGFDETDLELLFTALSSMFEHDHSAARGEMSSRKLIVFKHDSALGKAPAHALFGRVRVGRNISCEYCDGEDRGIGNRPPARQFSDYIVEIDRTGLPDGVEIVERL
jgi:CRISPR-associated protein Csd2